MNTKTKQWADIGFQGGQVTTHRSLLTTPRRNLQAWTALALTLGGLVLWWFCRNLMTDFWGLLMTQGGRAIGLSANLEQVPYHLGFLDFHVPFISFAAGLPDNDLWWIGLGIVLVLDGIAWLVPRHMMPVATILRVVAWFQLAANIFFALWPRAFPYNGPGYVHGTLIAGFFFVGLLPVILGLAYHPFSFTLRRRALLTVGVMLHFTVLFPVQFLLHAWVLSQASLLYLPLLFFVFGLPLDLLVFFGYYSWAIDAPIQLGRRPHSGGHVIPTAAALLLGFVLLAPAGRADAQETPRIWQPSWEVAYGYTDYSGTDDDGNSISGILRVAHGERELWTLDVSRQERFGDSGLGIGLGWRRELPAAWHVSAGLSTGTGEAILPSIRTDLGVGYTVQDVGVIIDAGYTHSESKEDASYDGFHLGAAWWAGNHLILSAAGHIDIGQPGSTTSRRVDLGATVHQWQRWAVGSGLTFGDVAYQLIGPDKLLVDYGSTSWYVDASWNWKPDRGIRVRYDAEDNDYYDAHGYSIAIFGSF